MVDGACDVSVMVGVSVAAVEAAICGGARVRGRLRGGPSSLSDTGLGDFFCASRL